MVYGECMNILEKFMQIKAPDIDISERIPGGDKYQ